MTKTITSYKICPDLNPDISTVGSQAFQVDGHDFTLEVIDTVSDYVQYMKKIFDFSAIKTLLQGSDGNPGLKVLINAMHGGNCVNQVNPILHRYSF